MWVAFTFSFLFLTISFRLSSSCITALWALVGGDSGAKFGVGGEWDHSKHGALLPTQADVAVSFSGVNTHLAAAPVNYEVAMLARGKAGQLALSYFHHTLWGPRQIALAGEFTHTPNARKEAQSVLTVGGLWQISQHSLAKARLSSDGKVGVLAGVHLRLSQVRVAITTSLGLNLLSSSKPTLGLTISLTNEVAPNKKP